MGERIRDLLNRSFAVTKRRNYTRFGTVALGIIRETAAATLSCAVRLG